MINEFRRHSVFLLALGISGLAFEAQADAPSFYAGKQMTFVAPTEPGGGYDAHSRLIARHLPKHIPGTPSFVVQNLPGAGGLRGTNFLANVAPKDGSAIGLVQNGLPFEPFYGNTQAQFDPTKLIWLGSPTKEVSVFLLWHTAPANTLADLKDHEVILGAGGASTGGAFYTRVLMSLFGVKIKQIQGYKGMTEALLAMEKGENQGYASSFWSTLKLTHDDWIREHKIKFVLRYSGNPLPGFESVPLAADLTTNAEDRLIMEIATAPFELGRPFAAPSGVPDDRAAILRTAVEETFKDPDYLKECGKQQLECDSPSSGEQIAALIRRTYAAPESVRQRLIAIHGDFSK